MTAPTSPGVVPADALLIAQTIAYQTNDISFVTEQDLIHRIYAAIMADRANRPSLTEDEREQVRREALNDKARIAAMHDAYKFVFPKLSDMQKEKGAIGVWVDAFRTAWDAAARASALANRSEPRQEKDSTHGL